MTSASSSSESRRNKRRHAASHQRSWLWGKHAVLETLLAGRWPVDELYLADELPDSVLREVESLIQGTELRPTLTAASRLSVLCGAEDHQGFLARMSDFPCGDAAGWQNCVHDCLANFGEHPSAADEAGQHAEPGLLTDARRPPLFVICDRIQDSHNFGAILRCCDGVGADAVLIESREQASVTPHVARASAGAANYLEIFRVDSLVESVDVLTAAGVSLAAASEKSDDVVWHQSLNRPVAVVIGSDGGGIRPELLQRCNLQLQIPMFGQVSSLNAAVAAGILLYEIRRQQMSAHKKTAR